MLPISLVITVFNREQYLAATIKSILKQTRGDFQLLIWDDGSTDHSLEIAQSFAQKDKRIEIVAAKHLGRGEALAQAINRTKGEYLGWVDSDDLLQPEALKYTMQCLEQNPQSGMIYTDCLIIDEVGNVLGLDPRTKVPFSPDKLLVQFMTFHFRLIRRDVYDQVGGVRPEFGTVEDYDLCLRLSEVTNFTHLPQPLYQYRVHKTSICSTQQLEQVQKTQKIIQEALQRRNLSDKLELELILKSQFKLSKKS